MRTSSKFATIVLLCLGLALCVPARPEPSFKLDSNVVKGGVSRDASIQTTLLGLAELQAHHQVGLSHEQSGTTSSTLSVPERRALKSKNGKTKKKKSKKNKKAVAAGSSLGVFLFVVIIMVIVFFIWRAKKKEKDPKWRARDMFKSSDKGESAAEKTKTAGDKESGANRL